MGSARVLREAQEALQLVQAGLGELEALLTVGAERSGAAPLSEALGDVLASAAENLGRADLSLERFPRTPTALSRSVQWCQGDLGARRHALLGLLVLGHSLTAARIADVRAIVARVKAAVGFCWYVLQGVLRQVDSSQTDGRPSKRQAGREQKPHLKHSVGSSYSVCGEMLGNGVAAVAVENDARYSGGEYCRRCVRELSKTAREAEEVRGDEVTPAAGDVPTVVSSTVVEQSDEEFARQVREAARSLVGTKAAFGDDRVYINRVWQALPEADRPTLAEFKRRLLEVNRKRLLSLSRGDMVELMNAADLAESETRYLGATLHFVDPEPPRPPAPSAPAPIGAFTRQVEAAARSLLGTTGAFGPTKVFISAVYRAMPAGSVPDLAGFKARLVEANREARVALARADLVSVMDPGLVRDSETVDGAARFHFVVLGGRP